MNYDLRKIMTRAWKLYRKAAGMAAGKALTFAEALHRAWLSAKAEPINAQRIEAARAAAGVLEPVNTWAGWRSLGFEVIHGSKALFKAVLIHGSKGDGATYTGSFFAASQVRPISTAA